MPSRRDKTVADATTKLGGAIAEALRSWAQDVGADDIASEVMDRVHEGFDVVLDRAKEAAGKARARAKSTTRRATSTGKKAKSTAKKARKKVSSAGQRKTTRKTPAKKKAVRKKA
jgi:hypothetical protein